MKPPTVIGDASWSPIARMAWVFVGLLLLPVSGVATLRTLPRLSRHSRRRTCPRCYAIPPVRKKIHSCPGCGCVYDQYGNIFHDLSHDPLKDLDLTRFNVKRVNQHPDDNAVRRPDHY